MKLFRSLFVAAVVACGGPAAIAQELEPDPYKLVRTLQRAQDEIAHGSQVAYDVQRKLLDHIANKFIKYPDHVWADQKNSEAAAVFALAGGDPQVGKWLLKNRTLAPEYTGILEGAVAFASRDYPEAAKLLADIEPLKYPGHLGGSLALVKAMLAAKKDPKKAAGLFAKTRLLVPGTLIEEAALRRSLVLFENKKDLPKLVATSSSYYRQFGRSVFGPVFDESLAQAVVKFDHEDLEKHQEKLSAAVKLTPSTRQKKIYLMFAKNAVVSGKMAFARFSSVNASSIDESDLQTQTRANLYMAAADIVTGAPEEALTALNKIDAKVLSDDDKKIMNEVSDVGSAIAQWPPAEAEKTKSQATEMPKEEMSSDDILSRVQPLMAEVDSILETLKK